ncbi:unnamed protein product, partial [Staurois parvus]
AENLRSAVDSISVSNAKCFKSRLQAFVFKFFLNSSSSLCCPEPFFHHEKCMQTFSRYSDGQNTEHRMLLPSLSHIVMTASHLRPLPPLETKDMLMTIHTSNSS